MDYEKVKYEDSVLCEFDLKKIENIELSPFDIFIRLESGKIIKICNHKDPINKELIDKCTKSAQATTARAMVLIRENDYNRMIQDMIDEGVVKIEQGFSKISGIDLNKKLNIQTSAVKMIRMGVKSIGFSDAIISLIDTNINSVIDTIATTPALKKIAADVLEKGNYFEQKALLISYLSSYVISRAKLKGYKNTQKICQAALLHDFKLINENLLIRDLIQNDESIRKSKEIKSYKDHAVLEATFLREKTDIESDVINIIETHHAPLFKDQREIVQTKTMTLSKLSQIFNIAHGFSVFLIENGITKSGIAEFYYKLADNGRADYDDSIQLFSVLLK